MLINIKTNEYKQYVEQRVEIFNRSKKPTIIVACDAYYPIIDGVVTLIHNYAEYLTNDYNVVIAAPATNHEVNIIDLNNKHILILCCNSKYYKKYNNSKAKPKSDRYFNKILNELKHIKLIHIHSPYFMGHFFMHFAKQHKIQVISTFHSLYYRDLLRSIHIRTISWITLKWLMQVFNHSCKVIVQHDGTKNVLLSYGFKYQDRIIKLPNVTNYQISNSNQDIQQLYQKYKIDKNKNILIFVGRIVKVKNIFFLAKVLKDLQLKKFDFQCIIVGNGPDFKKLQQKIKKYNLQERTIFTNEIKDKNELMGLYNIADLLVFPSTYDNSSLVQIEAASQHLCGLFIRNSVTATTITENINGYLCDENVESFSDKIIDIFNHPQMLSKCAKQAYLQLYKTYDDTYPTLKKIYDELISKQ